MLFTLFKCYGLKYRHNNFFHCSLARKKQIILNLILANLKSKKSMMSMRTVRLVERRFRMGVHFNASYVGGDGGLR